MVVSRQNSCQESFTIMSANLRFGLADDGQNSWEFRKHALLSLLRLYPADFINVQEANSFQTEFIEAALPEYHFFGQRSNAPEFWQDNIIFYKSDWEMLESRHFFLSHTPAIPSRFHDSRWPRQTTICNFTRNGKFLTIANTHLDFQIPVRVKSANLIMTALQDMAPHAPTVLTGDFNAEPFSPCYNVFTGTCPKEEADPALAFTDAFGESNQGTHHGFSGVAQAGRIDWILFRGGLHVLDNKIVTDKFDGFYPSDHFPVWAHLDWAAQ